MPAAWVVLQKVAEENHEREVALLVSLRLPLQTHISQGAVHFSKGDAGFIPG